MVRDGTGTNTGTKSGAIRVEQGHSVGEMLAGMVPIALRSIAGRVGPASLATVAIGDPPLQEPGDEGVPEALGQLGQPQSGRLVGRPQLGVEGVDGPGLASVVEEDPPPAARTFRHSSRIPARVALIWTSRACRLLCRGRRRTPSPRGPAPRSSSGPRPVHAAADHPPDDPRQGQAHLTSSAFSWSGVIGSEVLGASWGRSTSVKTASWSTVSNPCFRA